jgi:hypothetical protein
MVAQPAGAFAKVREQSESIVASVIHRSDLIM